MIQRPEPTDPVAVILKLVGKACNVNCLYCYEKRKDYDEQKFLAPDQACGALARHANRPLAIELHGGEPLLYGKSRMSGLLQALRARPNVASIAVQTNGTLLDPEWIDLLTRYGVDIGLSCDGPPAASMYRVGFEAAPFLPNVERALRLLECAGVKCGVVAVVTQASLGMEEKILQYFSKFPAISSVKFAPCFDLRVHPESGRTISHRLAQAGAGGANGAKDQPDWAVTPMQFAEFVVRIFDLWLANGRDQYILEPVLSILRKLRGAQAHSCHFESRKCDHVETVYPGGRVGSCDELPSHLFASTQRIRHIPIRSVPLKNTLIESQGLASLTAACSSCEVASVCGGGCISSRLQLEAGETRGQYCAHRKFMIRHIAQALG